MEEFWVPKALGCGTMNDVGRVDLRGSKIQMDKRKRNSTTT